MRFEVPGAGWHAEPRHAWRSLARQPVFATTIVLTLALGIGATTTVYSFLFALLVRPYPYADPDRLVQVQSVSTDDGAARRGMSLLDLEDYRGKSAALEGIGGYTTTEVRLLGDGPPEVVTIAQLNPQALSLLGVAPVAGRLLRPDEDRAGGDVNRAVISHQLWQSRYAGAGDIVGKAVRTDRRPFTYTIVGVMPPGFGFPGRASVWVPIESWY
jgi:hypothetical protein